MHCVRSWPAGLQVSITLSGSPQQFVTVPCSPLHPSCTVHNNQIDAPNMSLPSLAPAPDLTGSAPTYWICLPPLTPMPTSLQPPASWPFCKCFPEALHFALVVCPAWPALCLPGRAHSPTSFRSLLLRCPYLELHPSVLVLSPEITALLVLSCSSNGPGHPGVLHKDTSRKQAGLRGILRHHVAVCHEPRWGADCQCFTEDPVLCCRSAQRSAPHSK